MFKINLEEEMDKVKESYSTELLKLVRKLTDEGKTEEAQLLREIQNSLYFGNSNTSSSK